MKGQGESASAVHGAPGEGAGGGAELFPGGVAELPLEYLVINPASLAALYLEQLVPGAPTRLERIVDFLSRLPEPKNSVVARDYVVIYAALISADVNERGDAAEGIRKSEKAMERIGGLSSADLADCQLVLPWLWLAAGHAYAAAGHLREAQLLWHRVAQGEVAFPRFMSLCQTAMSQALVGDLRSSAATVALAEQLGGERGWFFGRYATPAIMAKALIAAGQLDLPALIAACADLERESRGVPQWFVGSEVIQALSLRLQGRPDEAIDRLQTIFYGSNDATVELIWDMLRHTRATLMLAQGMPGLVLRELEGVQSTPDHVVCLESTRAFALLSLGMGKEALAETTICVRRGNKHCPGTVQQALFARAGALHVLGRRRAAAQTFDRALAIGADAGYVAVTLLPISMLEELIADARERGVEVPSSLDPVRGQPANRLDWAYQRIGTLSDRERGLLLELRGEGTLESIADRMFLARNTVKAHSRRIYAKLGTQSRTEAVDIAETVGLFDVPMAYWSPDSLSRAS